MSPVSPQLAAHHNTNKQVWNTKKPFPKSRPAIQGHALLVAVHWDLCVQGAATRHHVDTGRTKVARGASLTEGDTQTDTPRTPSGVFVPVRAGQGVIGEERVQTRPPILECTIKAAVIAIMYSHMPLPRRSRLSVHHVPRHEPGSASVYAGDYCTRGECLQSSFTLIHDLILIPIHQKIQGASCRRHHRAATRA